MTKIFKKVVSQQKYVLLFSLSMCAISFFNFKSNSNRNIHKVCNLIENTTKKNEVRIVEDAIPAFWETWKIRDGGIPKCPPGLTLLILVTSDPSHFEKRQVIRKTWGNPYWGNFSGQVRAIFLVGNTSEENNVKVNTEFKEHGDVLVGEYKDVYRNLTFKVLNGFTWVAEHCSTKFLMKTDDDSFINVPLIMNHLGGHARNSKGLYVGYMKHNDPVFRIKDFKWSVSEKLYPDPLYPTYASGVGYILSVDVLKPMLKLTRRVTPFPCDDPFVGLLAFKAGVRPIFSDRFVMLMGEQKVDWMLLCKAMVLNKLMVNKVHYEKGEIPLNFAELIDFANLARTNCTNTKPNAW